jgi:signal transduction histidine kinase
MQERPNAKVEHELYRITQELINNTLKYSRARNVSIGLVKSKDSLSLMYEDDGVGYDIHMVKKGDGLRNIQTRVKSLRGTVEFDSMPNAGARTTIEIPQ